MSFQRGGCAQVGIPLLFWSLLRWNRDVLHTVPVAEKIGFLYQGVAAGLAALCWSSLPSPLLAPARLL